MQCNVCMCVSVKEGVMVSRTRCFHKVEVEVLEVHSCSGSFSGREIKSNRLRDREREGAKPGMQTDFFLLHTLTCNTQARFDQLVSQNKMREEGQQVHAAS